MIGFVIHPGDSDTAVNAWDICTPIVVGLIIALWPAGKGSLASFGRTFGLSGALSFFVYAATLAVLYVFTFAGAIISAGINALGFISESQLNAILGFMSGRLWSVLIVGAQLNYIWRAVRSKRRGEFAFG